MAGLWSSDRESRMLLSPITAVSVGMWTNVTEQKERPRNLYKYPLYKWVCIPPKTAQMVERSVSSVECHGFESHLRYLINFFFGKVTTLGVLRCFALLFV